MSKPRKKPTNKEMTEAILAINAKLHELNNAINIVGQTMSDYIDFEKNEEPFLTHLKDKYKKHESKKEE